MCYIAENKDMRNYMTIAKQSELYVLKMITRQSRNLFMLIAFFSSIDAMNPRTNRTGVVSLEPRARQICLIIVNKSCPLQEFFCYCGKTRAYYSLFIPSGVRNLSINSM